MDYVHTVVDHNEHESNPERAAALFVLKTREEGRLTQRALNQVALNATSLCDIAYTIFPWQVKRVTRVLHIKFPGEISRHTVLIYTLPPG